MKQLSSILAAALLIGATIPAAKAAVTVSVDFFHDNLESYGDWREVGDYGYCWQPRDVDRDWRPYSDGRWIYTDAGWTWVSDEPYSWAVYHYGRWARVDQVGWVWVPGTEWGPAWVSWRRSPRYVGWAPLPPDARFRRSVGFNARVDADYDIGPTNYSFVEVRNFGAPRLRTVIVEPRQNITIISQTTNITNITYVNNVVYNEGPQYDVISRESEQPIRRLKLERREELDGDPATVRAEQLRTRVEGDSLRVVALPFDSKPATAPRKLAAKVEKAKVNRGWKDAGPPAEVAKLRTKMNSEPATTAERPPKQKTEKAAEASAVTPDQAPVQDEEPATPDAPDIAPPQTEKAVAPDRPAKPGKTGKRAKPVQDPSVGSMPPSAPVEEVAAPSSQSKKDKSKEIEASRPPAVVPPEAQVPKSKKKSSKLTPKLPPAADVAPRQKPHPDKRAAQPKPAQPDARSIPAPHPEAERPDSHPQPTPAVTEPEPGTEKDKSDKKGKKAQR